MKINVQYIKSEYIVDVSNGLSNCCNASPQGEVSNRESRKDSGGFLTHVSDPQTALPFDITDVGLDASQKAKLVGNVVALTVQAVGALQAYRRDHPDKEGMIPIKDLAKYISRYSDDMAKNKGTLRPQYRQQILNGLTLATLAGTSYIISRDKKTGKARHGVVYLIDRITEYETNKKGDIIAVKTDFTQEYKASLQYNLGVLTDGVSKLKSPEAINLATYISDRQVAEQDKTVAGKPITFTADTLCKKASIVDKHVTKRYSTLAKLLDELQTESVAVGRWVTKSKAKAITGYDKDSQTLYIYPTTTAQNSYTTRERTRAGREVVNILNPEQHRYIGRPTTMGLLDMITKTIDGKDLADLKEQYLDRESRKDSDCKEMARF